MERLAGHAQLGDDLARALRDDRQPRGEITFPGFEGPNEIHRGGQGIVFRALQLSTRRTVALKLLADGPHASGRARQRFEREVELSAGLDHPNIVTVYDSGETRDGRRFFVMEWVDGVTPTAAALDLRVRDRVALFLKIAKAVHFAHLRGVLHRDLKPGNVLVDASGEPHVLDFGLAVPASIEPAEQRSRITVTGEFVGTFAYASPEHVSGDLARVDVRSDVYSLGVMLYEMLTGQLPYSVDGSVVDAVRAITEVEPLAPSARARNAGLDPELDAIALQALAKECERRYQSVGELALDLRRYLAGEPIGARGQSAWYVVRRSLRRHRVIASASLFVVLAIASAAVVSTVFWRNAVHAADDATGEADRAKRSLNLFRRMLLAPAHVARPGEPLTLRDALAWAGARVAIEFEDFPETELEVRDMLAEAYETLDAAELADPHMRRALALRIQLGRADVETAQQLYHVARDYQKVHEALAWGFPPGDSYRDGERPLLVSRGAGDTTPEASAQARMKLEESAGFALAAAQVRAREYGAGSKKAMTCRRVYALCLRDLGERARARAVLEGLAAASEGATDEGSLEKRAEVLGELGVLAFDELRFEDGLALFREAERLRAEPEQDLSEQLLARGNVAVVLCALDRPEEARALLADTVDRASSALGERDWRTALQRINLAEVQLRLGSPAAARAALEPCWSAIGDLAARDHALSTAANGLRERLADPRLDER
ncbi:MAG: serine/threonine protein kinase [bacterium]|nr:serine/threonine protein kinase [bacterium]